MGKYKEYETTFGNVFIDSKRLLNHIARIDESLEYLGTHYIKVGVLAKPDTQLYMKAMANEYGARIEFTDAVRKALLAQLPKDKRNTANENSPPKKYIEIPERSFIRSTFDNLNMNEVKQIVEVGLEHILNDDAYDGEDLLRSLGEYLRSQIVRTITKLKEPPNSPYTVAVKGSSNPLIDTGELRSSISYELVAR